MILETERLSLSELSPEDAPFILELLTSRGFKENIGDRGVRDLEGAAGYIDRARAGYAANGFGLWRCDVKATGEAAGLCGLVKRDTLLEADVALPVVKEFIARVKDAALGQEHVRRRDIAVHEPHRLAVAIAQLVRVVERIADLLDPGRVVAPPSPAGDSLISESH